MDETVILWARPTLLLLLLLVPLIPVGHGLLELLRHRRLRRFGEQGLVKELMPSHSTSLGWVKCILLTLALGAFVVGLAQPRSGAKYAERTVSGSHIVVALDVSNSMLADDYTPNRLARAKAALRMLTRGLQGSGERNDRIGLVVFAGDAYVQLPVTSDYASAEMFLDGISPSSVAVQGTDIAKALTLASRCLMDGDSDAGKAIVLISDGESHEEDPVPVAQSIHENGISIFTIGVGAPEGRLLKIDGAIMHDDDGKPVMTSLDEKTLSAIAEAGGGAYIRASDRDFGLERVVTALRQLQAAQYDTLVFDDYQEYYMYFYAIALLLLVVEVLLGDRRILLLAGLGVVSCSQGPYIDAMRDGARAFDRGDYTAAAGHFKTTLSDTTFAGLYNYALASRGAEDEPEAQRALDTLRRQELVEPGYEALTALNLANSYLTDAVRTEAASAGMPQQQAGQGGADPAVQRYQMAVKTYEDYLLMEPGDMDAKERYLFAKSKLPPDGGGGGGGDNDQNQDQNDQNQDQNQDQNNDQNDQNQDQDQNNDQNDNNQDQNDQDQNQGQQPRQDQLDEDQIFQMLEMKEKKTREKVDEKKAQVVGRMQKDKKKW